MFWRLKKTLSPVVEEKTIDEKKNEEARQLASRREKIKRIEYTREEASRLLNRMYRFGIKEDYLEGPGAHDYSACSSEFLDEDILCDFQRKFEDLGYAMDWSKKYRHWSYASNGSQYAKNTLQYWFYLQPLSDVKISVDL